MSEWWKLAEPEPPDPCGCQDIGPLLTGVRADGSRRTWVCESCGSTWPKESAA